jgi:hypothetical protein
LAKEVRDQRILAASAGTPLVVLGELNSSPQADTRDGFPRPQSYDSHKQVCLTRACLAIVPGKKKKDGTIPALAPRLRDYFRARHPSVNGATHIVKNQVPARHTLILLPRRYKVLGSTVDAARRWWPDSDHYMLSTWVSYKDALGIKGVDPSPLGGSLSVPALCTKFLKSPKLKEKWRQSLLSSTGWQASLLAMGKVDAGTIDEVQTAVFLLEEAVKEAAAPFQPKPPVGPRKGTTLISPAWSILESEASDRRAALHASHDPVTVRAPLLAAWHSLCSLGIAAQYEVGQHTSDIWDLEDWDSWRSRAAAACGATLREGVRRRHRASTACVKHFIERRQGDG